MTRTACMNSCSAGATSKDKAMSSGFLHSKGTIKTQVFSDNTAMKILGEQKLPYNYPFSFRPMLIGPE